MEEGVVCVRYGLVDPLGFAGGSVWLCSMSPAVGSHSH